MRVENVETFLKRHSMFLSLALDFSYSSPFFVERFSLTLFSGPIKIPLNKIIPIKFHEEFKADFSSQPHIIQCVKTSLVFQDFRLLDYPPTGIHIHQVRKGAVYFFFVLCHRQRFKDLSYISTHPHLNKNISGKEARKQKRRRNFSTNQRIYPTPPIAYISILLPFLALRRLSTGTYRLTTFTCSPPASQ